MTDVRARVRLRRLVIGHTLPRAARIDRVTVDGERADYSVRTTNRGVEVLVRVPDEGRHRLVVVSR